jgi:hypothetical protein
MPVRLSSLGNVFRSRFERLGDLGDIDEASIAHQQSVRLNPDGHPDKPMYLNNFGISFRGRSRHVDDVDETISIWLRSDPSVSPPMATPTCLDISITLEYPS